jgi:hypothetical protein
MGEQTQRRRQHDGAEADQLTETLEAMHAERDRRRAAGEDTAWLDEVLREPPPVAVLFFDLDVVLRLQDVVARHGTGPWAPRDLAAIAGVDEAAVQRVLEQMARAGLEDSPQARQ